MYIILGGTGHVGTTVAQTLLKEGEPVTIITRDSNKMSEWEQKGAKVKMANVQNENELRSVFHQGKRLFLLNPPADPSTDTDREERKNVRSILTALRESTIEKIVAQSTYGAQPGEKIGDLAVLYEMEQGLANLSIPYSVIRAAYYMSNWDHSYNTVQQEGKLYTLYPPDFKIPMVAPQDLGKVAAQLLREPISKNGLYYVEGPEVYSSAEVATAFSNAFNKRVEVVEIPRTQWVPALKTMGFSQAGAESMAAMTAITLEKKYDIPHTPIRGTTTLQEYISKLVSNQK